MSSAPIPVSGSQSPTVPQRRSLLYDIARIVRRSQTAAKRRSILYDIAHIVLPVSFFLHFVITGTVVLIYTLYLHQPIPARYSIGSAIAFGILTVLILLAYLWLYCRRRHKLREDPESASNSTPNGDANKELENSSPATDLQTHRKQHKKWTHRVRDFLIEYESRHYNDLLKDRTCYWQVPGQKINWEGLRIRVLEFFEPVTDIFDPGAGARRRSAERRQSIADFMALRSPRPQVNIESDPTGSMGIEMISAVVAQTDTVGIRQEQVLEDPINEPERRTRSFATSSRVGVSTEVHVDAMSLRDRNQGSCATDLGVQVLDKNVASDSQPPGLSPSPSHQTVFSRGPAQQMPTTKESVPHGHRISVIATSQTAPQRQTRTPTPVPADIVRETPLYGRKRTHRHRRDPGARYTTWKPPSAIYDTSALQQQQEGLLPPLRISANIGALTPGNRQSQVSAVSIDTSPGDFSSRDDREVSPGPILPPIAYQLPLNQQQRQQQQQQKQQQKQQVGSQPTRDETLNTVLKSTTKVVPKEPCDTNLFSPVNTGLDTLPKKDKSAEENSKSSVMDLESPVDDILAGTIFMTDKGRDMLIGAFRSLE